MASLRIGRMKPAAIGLVALLFSIASVSAQEHVTIDFGRSHQFVGFGAQIWTSAQNKAARSALLRDMHARFVRVSLDMGMADEGYHGHMSTDQILAAVQKRRDNPAVKSVRAADAALESFSGEVRELGLIVHVVSWQAPSAWSIPLPNYGMSMRKAINPAYINDYANQIMAILFNVRRFGIMPEAIEVTNELEGGWNNKYSPAEYADLVAAVRRRLDSSPFATVKIEGPGTSGATASDYIWELERRGSLGMLANFTVHIYNRLHRPRISGLSEVPSPLLTSIDRPIFVTEYNTDSPDWRKQGTPPSTVGPAEVTNTVAFGVAVAGETLRLINDGAAATIYWQLEDLYWSKSSWGLLDLQGKRRPVADVLTKLSSAVLLPAAAALVQGTTDSFAIAAFRGGNVRTIAIANTSTDDREIVLKGLGDLPGMPQVVASFYEPQSAPVRVTMNSGVPSVRMPAGSVAVLQMPP